jgi:hypothetical protein
VLPCTKIIMESSLKMFHATCMWLPMHTDEIFAAIYSIQNTAACGATSPCFQQSIQVSPGWPYGKIRSICSSWHPSGMYLCKILYSNDMWSTGCVWKDVITYINSCTPWQRAWKSWIGNVWIKIQSVTKWHYLWSVEGI